MRPLHGRIAPSSTSTRAAEPLSGRLDERHRHLIDPSPFSAGKPPDQRFKFRATCPKSGLRILRLPDVKPPCIFRPGPWARPFFINGLEAGAPQRPSYALVLGAVRGDLCKNIPLKHGSKGQGFCGSRLFSCIRSSAAEASWINFAGISQSSSLIPAVIMSYS